MLQFIAIVHATAGLMLWTIPQGICWIQSTNVLSKH